MCPYDKLTGCQKVYGDTDIRGDRVYDELASMVQGVMLGVDNELLDFCQNAVDEAEPPEVQSYSLLSSRLYDSLVY